MAITSGSLVKWSVIYCCMLGVGVLMAISLCHCYCIVFYLFVLLFYFLTSIHGTVTGVGLLLAVTLSSIPNWVVAGVSVSLATACFCSFLHSPGRVARAGVPLAVHPFF